MAGPSLTGETGMWRMAGAGVVGASHLRANLPCQDRWDAEILGSHTLIVVVADGAGSAARAEQGAAVVVAAIMRHVREAIEEGQDDYSAVLRGSAARARRDLVATSERDGLPLGQYAATALAVVLGPTGGAALQVGDGVIIVGEGTDDWSWVFWPHKGEYANTTRFLTDEDALEVLEVEGLTARVHDVLVMSDGLEHLALVYGERAVFNPFVKAIVGPLRGSRATGHDVGLSEALRRFLVSDRVASRADDDLSLVVATRSALLID